MGGVFRITSDGAFSVLYSFKGGADGNQPYAGVIQGKDGYFYGMCMYGGGSSNAGDIFQLQTSGTNVLFNSVFTFTGTNGAYPAARLVMTNDGAFYGTTTYGGAHSSGTVFQLKMSGTTASVNTLYSFGTIPNDGSAPNGLVIGQDGDLYGTTSTGGMFNQGTIFKITTSGSFASIYSFGSGAGDGRSPNTLAQDASGTFYGTSVYGGAYGNGTIFKFTSNSVLTTMYSFSSLQYNNSNGGYSNQDGANPEGSLMLGSDGDFYGTTSQGGPQPVSNAFTTGVEYGIGTIFRITPTGIFTVLYAFPQDSGGYVSLGPMNPFGALVEGTDGNLYGTSYEGGPLAEGGFGTVFRLNTRLGAPTAVTGSANSITINTASVTGTANPSGYATSVYFQRPVAESARIRRDSDSRFDIKLGGQDEK
jgi:uncharacterized repeat protein (TIGR03803 family)